MRSLSHPPDVPAIWSGGHPPHQPRSLEIWHLFLHNFSSGYVWSRHDPRRFVSVGVLAFLVVNHAVFATVPIVAFPHGLCSVSSDVAMCFLLGWTFGDFSGTLVVSRLLWMPKVELQRRWKRRYIYDKPRYDLEFVRKNTIESLLMSHQIPRTARHRTNLIKLFEGGSSRKGF